VGYRGGYRRLKVSGESGYSTLSRQIIAQKCHLLQRYRFRGADLGGVHFIMCRPHLRAEDPLRRAAIFQRGDGVVAEPSPHRTACPAEVANWVRQVPQWQAYLVSQGRTTPGCPKLNSLRASGGRDRRLIQAEEQQGTKIPIDTLLAGPRFDALLVGWIVFPQGLHVLVQEKKTFRTPLYRLPVFFTCLAVRRLQCEKE
jgi:hypothetical protein